jgi:hypothetical protein
LYATTDEADSQSMHIAVPVTTSRRTGRRLAIARQRSTGSCKGPLPSIL